MKLLYFIFKWKSLYAIIFSAVTCNTSKIENATMYPDMDTVNANTTVIYNCSDGYTHTGGDLNRTCNGSGQWTGRPPICTGKLLSLT